MQTIRNLICADLTALQGKKHSLRRLLIFIILLSVFTGMLVTPYLLPFVMVIVAAMLPEHLEKMTNGTEKMYGILPVTRKEIAASRYLLLTGILTGLLVLYLLIAAVTDFGGLPGSVLASELRNLSSAVELKPDPSALFRTDLLLNGAGFLISAAVLARKLRRYFRSFGSGMKKQKKFPLLRKLLSMIGIVIALEAFLLFVLFGGRFSSVLGRFISMAMHFLSTVSEILNGSLLFVCLLTVGFCAAAYQYVCAYLEFEQKDI